MLSRYRPLVFAHCPCSKIDSLDGAHYRTQFASYMYHVVVPGKDIGLIIGKIVTRKKFPFSTPPVHVGMSVVNSQGGSL